MIPMGLGNNADCSDEDHSEFIRTDNFTTKMGLSVCTNAPLRKKFKTARPQSQAAAHNHPNIIAFTLLLSEG
jgi:hypothetical protein